MILSVEDLKAFHKENLERNKVHYTYMNRATKAKLVNYFQDKGSKVHFNHVQIEDPELSKETGKKELVVRKYIKR